MSKFIPLSVPSLQGRELEYVSDAITSEWVSTAGPYVTKFEDAIAKYVASPYAIACQSGTAGLHTALVLLGVGAGDEVLVPTLTFIAAVNPVTYVNAKPVFVDCDDSLCMDPERLFAFCQTECTMIDGKLLNNKTGNHVKALIVVHVFGNIANMERLVQIAEEFGLKIIEDATEALGSKYIEGKFKGKHAGTIGDIGVYSFNGNKIITTGGGGMIVTQDEMLGKRARYLTTQAKDDEVAFIHDAIGFNYRLTNLQAAVGLAQIEQLDTFIETKRSNYKLYAQEIPKIKGLKFLEFDQTIAPNYWFYSLFVDSDFPLSANELIQYLSKNKVQTRPIWGLISQQKPYLNAQNTGDERASYYHKHIVNVPCSSNLTREDVLSVIDLLKLV